jgi:hypothetical protein
MKYVFIQKLKQKKTCMNYPHSTYDILHYYKPELRYKVKDNFEAKPKYE